MNWQPYPQTKPPKAGEYLVWQSFKSDTLAEVVCYTKRDGFCDENGGIDEWVTHWCVIVPPGATSGEGAGHADKAG